MYTSLKASFFGGRMMSLVAITWKRWKLKNNSQVHADKMSNYVEPLPNKHIRVNLQTNPKESAMIKAYELTGSDQEKEKNIAI
jgi:hypothetical protein